MCVSSQYMGKFARPLCLFIILGEKVVIFISPLKWTQHATVRVFWRSLKKNVIGMHLSFNIKHFAVHTSRSEKILGHFLGGRDLYRHSSLSLFCLSYYANMVSLDLLMPRHLVSDTMNIFLGFYSTLFCPVTVCMCRFFALVLRWGIIALLSISVKG